MGVTAWPRVVWGDTLAESCEGDSLAESCWRVTVWLTGVGVTAWPRVVGGGDCLARVVWGDTMADGCVTLNTV